MEFGGGRPALDGEGRQTKDRPSKLTLIPKDLFIHKLLNGIFFGIICCALPPVPRTRTLDVRCNKLVIVMHQKDC